MEHQIVGDTIMPAWFDEGNARAEEFTIAGTEWWAELQRYRAVSMDALGSLFTLEALTSGSAWSQRTEEEAKYQYAVAAIAVQFLRSDVGLTGERLMFDLMAQGRTFEEAYRIVAGRSVADFSAGFGKRVRALTFRWPGLVVVPGTQSGLGMTFIAWGLPANAAITYAISGTSSSRQLTDTTEAYGTFWTYIDNSWPAGFYTITINWSGGSIRESWEKPN
jgi:hypothetical protein